MADATDRDLSLCEYCKQINLAQFFKGPVEDEDDAVPPLESLGKIVPIGMACVSYRIGSGKNCALRVFISSASAAAHKELTGGIPDKHFFGMSVEYARPLHPVKFRRLFLSLDTPTATSSTLGPGRTRSSLEWKTFVVNEQDDGPSESVVEDSMRPDWIKPTIGRMDLAADAGSPAARFISRRIVRPPLSDVGLTQMHEWLEDCNTHHHDCQTRAGPAGAPTSDVPLPTRVLDVGTEAFSLPLRILVANGMHGRYAALSHRWSSRPFTQLRSDSLEAFRRELPAVGLPDSFLDAIRVTRALGVQYLWIDSLCIVQDDNEDWEREAGRMGAIYENAYCTIAATRSVDGSPFIVSDIDRPQANLRWPQNTGGGHADSPSDSQSDFWPYNDVLVQALELPCVDGRAETGSFYFTRTTKPDHIRYISNAALNRRGWVVQERLLSRRILHFAQDQMYWECRSVARAQDGTVFRPGSMVGFTFPLASLTWQLGQQVREGQAAGSPRLPADEKFEQTWLSIVAQYTSCGLTLEKDRLPAIYGLASRLANFTDKEYIDGHWFRPAGGTLPASLLWTPSRTRRTVPEQFRGPRWSWVVAEGEVTFQSAHSTTQVSLLGYERAERAGMPNFMTLRILGQLLEVSLRKGEDQGSQRDVAEPPTHEVYPVFASGVPGLRPGMSIGNITFDFADDIPAMIKCLYLFTDFSGYAIVLALALEEVDSDGRWVYRRVGIGSLARGRGAMFSQQAGRDPLEHQMKKEITLV